MPQRLPEVMTTRFLPLVVAAQLACPQEYACGQLSAPTILVPPRNTTGGEETALSEIPLEALLAHVPKAGCEWRFDHVNYTGIEDPVSVELGRRLSAGATLSDEQWRYVLLKSGAIIVRENWPSDTPFAISMTVPRWLGTTQIRAIPHLKALHSAQVGERLWSFSGTWTAIQRQQAKYQILGSLPSDARSITFDVTVESGKNALFVAVGPARGILWEGQLAFRVSTVATIDEAVPPTSNDELDEAVRQSIGAGVRTWHESGKQISTVYVVVDPDTERFPALARTGLALSVEVLHRGKPVEEGSLVASRLDALRLANSVSTASLRFYASRNLRTIPPAVVSDLEESQEWTLRISGVSDHVLLLWDAEVRWGGTIMIPIAEAIARERERTGPAGRGPEVYTPSPR